MGRDAREEVLGGGTLLPGQGFMTLKEPRLGRIFGRDSPQFTPQFRRNCVRCCLLGSRLLDFVKGVEEDEGFEGWGLGGVCVTTLSTEQQPLKPP